MRRFLTIAVALGDGYSSTPLPNKLGIKPGMRVHVVSPPPDYAALLGVNPAVITSAEGDDALDFVHLFLDSRAVLEAALPALRARIAPAGMIWVSWPKKASKVRTDVTEDVVRDVALRNGLVDVKVCAIDATWSGLKLVIPVAQRPRV
jgi:hypothetical protein